MPRQQTYTVQCLVDGEETFDKPTAQWILSIHHRETLNSHLDDLGINGKRLTWDNLKEILKLKEFLMSRQGGNSREMYLNLSPVQVARYFQLEEIDIDAKLERLKSRYSAKFPRHGVAKYETSYSGGFTNPANPQEPLMAGG